LSQTSESAKSIKSIQQNGSFTDAKNEFDKKFKNSKSIPQSLVTVNGKIKNDIKIRNEKNELLEEYYKWQFLYGLLRSGLFTKDYVGVEVGFPKGSKSSAPLKIDGCIFDDKNWINHYQKLKKDHSDSSSLDFLRKHLICVIEFKRKKICYSHTWITYCFFTSPWIYNFYQEVNKP